jgi:hypothetical protein
MAITIAITIAMAILMTKSNFKLEKEGEADLFLKRFRLSFNRQLFLNLI